MGRTLQSISIARCFLRDENSARALRDATQKLRAEKGVSLEGWVNFVRYGA